MKRLAMLGLMLSLVAGCNGGSSSTPTSTNASLPRIIADLVQSELDQHPALKLGVTVGIIQPGSGGFVSKLFFFGKLSDENGNPLVLNGGTEFEIGSVTKTFTATILASILQGQPSVLDTITNTIFSGTPTFSGAQTKIGELANYTSGLPDLNRGTGSTDCTFSGGTITPCFDLDLMFTHLADPTITALQFAPGTEYLYSDLGFALLALAEPVLNGSTTTDPLELLAEWETMLGSIVLEPLAMNSTHAFDPVNDPGLLPQGFVRDSTGKIGPAFGFNTTWPAYIGAGGIVSTPDDMMIYLEYNLGLLTTPLNNLLPSLHSPSTTVMTPAGEQIGLGWFLGTLAGSSIQIISKNGEVPSFTTQIDFAPSTNTGVFVMTNSSAAPGLKKIVDAQTVAYKILQIINGLSPSGPSATGDQP